MLPTEVVPTLTQAEKKEFLESSIFFLSMREPFLAGILTEMDIRYSDVYPTCIKYDVKRQEFEIILNTKQFKVWNVKERAAVLQHEILHFAHRHMLRVPEPDPKKHKVWNIAMDMAINQYIPNLPQDCVDVKKFKTDKGEPFPLLKTMETYFELLEQNQEGNKEEMDKYGANPMDSHEWEEIDDETLRKMAEEAKKIVKRTIEKTSTSHSEVPDSLKDLLIKLDELTSKLQYKKILKDAIKRSVSAKDRESTWNRPNKRYGVYAPGTRTGRLPKISVLIDTSGSISHKELSEFLGIMSNFLKVGTKTCMLGLWHTNLYYYKPFKLKSVLREDQVESGGTAVTAALEKVNETNPDLTIILTDGYFEKYEGEVNDEVIWIISKGGNRSHPMSHLGKTIMLDGIV